MPREPRLQVSGATFHVVHRGNHRERIFFGDDDYLGYLHLLALMSGRYETRIHAYVLMTNHVHLLMTPLRPDGVSRTIQHVAATYSRRINERLERKGALWEGRFRAALVDSDYYCLACYRYIEMNPVRAGMVASPADYRWSSYQENVGRRGVRIVAPHQSFLALGDSPDSRIDSYRALLCLSLPERALASIRDGTRQGLPIGRSGPDLTSKPGVAIAGKSRRRGRPRNPRAP